MRQREPRGIALVAVDGRTPRSVTTIELARAELAARLRGRVIAIVDAVLTRIWALAGPADGDPVYAVGLEGAVIAAVAYGLDGVEQGPEATVPIPLETARQARRAAREGVALDTVLCRCAAGNWTLQEFIVAAADGIPYAVLCEILNELGPHLDGLMKAVAAEYRSELEQIQRSTAKQRADRVWRLLKSNSLVSPADLDYDFDAWHVGTILVGPTADRTIRALAEMLGYRCLSVVREHEITWAWVGSVRRPVSGSIERSLVERAPTEVSMAIGEPRRGLAGWRQTHHEAKAAFQVMLHRPSRVTRCRDVLLVSAIMRDQSLATALVETYLTPLNGRGNSAKVLRSTLRAYFEADQNAASAAASLGVARQTVDRRLRSVEQRLGQELPVCGTQLRVALTVEELADRLHRGR